MKTDDKIIKVDGPGPDDWDVEEPDPISSPDEYISERY